MSTQFYIEYTPAREILNGEISPGQLQGIMPDVPCRLVKFQSYADNLSIIYIGSSPAVSHSDDPTDAPLGFELLPGKETDWLPIKNLNQLSYVKGNASSKLIYLALR